MAAEGLGDLVQLTSTDALKPFVVQITGTAQSAGLERLLLEATLRI